MIARPSPGRRRVHAPDPDSAWKPSASGCRRAYSIDSSRNCCEPPAVSAAQPAGARLPRSGRPFFRCVGECESFIVHRAGFGSGAACARPPSARHVCSASHESAWPMSATAGVLAACGAPALAGQRCCGAAAAPTPAARRRKAATILPTRPRCSPETCAQHGDCRSASEDYAAAAMRSGARDRQPGQRSGLACENCRRPGRRSSAGRRCAPGSARGAELRDRRLEARTRSRRRARPLRPWCRPPAPIPTPASLALHAMLARGVRSTGGLCRLEPRGRYAATLARWCLTLLGDWRSRPTTSSAPSTGRTRRCSATRIRGTRCGCWRASPCCRAMRPMALSHGARSRAAGCDRRYL